MFLSKRNSYLAVLILLVFASTACRTGGSDYMSERQRKRIESTYASLEKTYDSLLTQYNATSDSMPDQLNELYRQMEQMHQQMSSNHQLMMTRNQGMGQHMQDNKMMQNRMQMGRMMQNHMTGEWYSQMEAMHQQMAAMHMSQGQQSMAEMHQRLQKQFDNLRNMMPESDDGTEQPFNEEGNPEMLNGERLFTQNCSSCHGANAQGVSNVFPPLVDSRLVTGDKSVPIRILLHGLQGEVEVEGATYNGLMPSFKARLSAAEIASILNYLRDESEGDYPEITQQDVIDINNQYGNRKNVWQAEDLLGEE